MSGQSKKISFWLIFGFLIVALSLVALFYFYPKKEVKEYNIQLDGGNNKEIKFQYGIWPELGDVNFFHNVLNKMINQKMDFILADLDEMKITVYKNGEIVEAVPIIAKGREGSWFETPVGLYKIEAKFNKAYSRFANVYMNYALAFEGNFLIHGWPYYPNGRKVDSSYSGGCIRLFDEDAKKIYDLAEIDMPVLVFKKDLLTENSSYRYSIPELSAEAYLAVDLKNNFVFLEKNKNQKFPIASITKLVTALAVLDHTFLEYNITVPKEALIFTSIPRLKAGQKISVFDLLALLLVESSNEAGVTLANYLGTDKLIEWMNDIAKSIGMINTNFVDANGIESENVSTPIDLYQLARYLYFNRSFIFKMTKGIFDNTYYGQPIYELKNLNFFADNNDFVGGKVGKTDVSKETMLAVFELQFNGEKRPIVFIALKSDDVKSDILKMVDFVKTHYQIEL
ncbi:MAG: L,D-transpeptidase family protein [Minisyncoccia bacterium]